MGLIICQEKLLLNNHSQLLSNYIFSVHLIVFRNSWKAFFLASWLFWCFVLFLPQQFVIVIRPDLPGPNISLYKVMLSRAVI